MAVRLRAYKDFRAYLKAYYLHEKAKDPAFSYGAFAKRAGLANRGHLKNVLSYGKRLSTRTTGQYVKALRLGEKDAAYFRLLVAHGQATKPRDQEASRAALDRWRAEHHYRALPADAFGRFPNPFLLGVLYAMAALKGFRPDARWISRVLLKSVLPKEIRRAIDHLFREGHLERVGRGVRRKGGLRLDETDVSPIFAEAKRWILDERIRSWEYPSVFAAVPLSPEQVDGLRESQIRWLQEHVLGKPPAGKGGEEMRLVLWEILPLTSGASRSVG